MAFRPPPGDDSNPALVEIIADEIDREGPITFARFMELATGHPEHGYYTASIERVGRSGDFLTAPETHPLFGWLVARQILEFWEVLGSRPELVVREHGAGRGTLGQQILDWFGAHPPNDLRRVRYELDDLNPDHPAQLPSTVAHEVESLNVEIVPASGSVITGVVLANELLDALPFHRLVYSGGEFRELRVGFEQGWFVDEPSPVSHELRAELPSGLSLGDGQRVELSPAVSKWIADSAANLERGFLLLIDYGYERPELYDTARFPSGTLKTYRHHEVSDNPYLHIGRQDITAHVDFSLAIDAATSAGLRLEGVTTQAEFVAGLGLDEILMEIQRTATDANVYQDARTAAMELLNPGGLGRFRVAIFSRDVESSGPVQGLAFRMHGLSGSPPSR